jgi:hypothetical protein
LALWQQVLPFFKDIRDKSFVHISKWGDIQLHLLLKEIQDTTPVGDFTDEIGR